MPQAMKEELQRRAAARGQNPSHYCKRPWRGSWRRRYELNPSEPVEFHTTAFLVKSKFYDPLDEEIDVKVFQAMAQVILSDLIVHMHELACEGTKAGILLPNPEL